MFACLIQNFGVLLFFLLFMSHNNQLLDTGAGTLLNVDNCTLPNHIL